jgi:hypothetical protein
MARSNYGSSQSPRARRDSTQDPLEHQKGDVQTTAGNYDYEKVAATIEEQSETYRQKYEADGYEPGKRRWRPVTRGTTV